jgi:hypothetical protein
MFSTSSLFAVQQEVAEIAVKARTAAIEIPLKSFFIICFISSLFFSKTY